MSDAPIQWDRKVSTSHILWFLGFIGTIAVAGWTVRGWQVEMQTSFERALAKQAEVISAQQLSMSLAQSDNKRTQEDILRLSREFDGFRKDTTLSLQSLTDRLTDIRLSISNLPTTPARR